MSKVAVVFHSGYGHTVKQAEAVAKGAKALWWPSMLKVILPMHNGRL